MIQNQISQTLQPLMFPLSHIASTYLERSPRDLGSEDISQRLTFCDEFSSSYLIVGSGHKSGIKEGKKVKGVLRNDCADCPPERKEPVKLNQLFKLV